MEAGTECILQLIGETPTSLYNLTSDTMILRVLNIRASDTICTFSSLLFHLLTRCTVRTLSCIFRLYMQADLRKGATLCETPLILVLFKLSPLIFKAVRASDYILGSWTHRDLYFTTFYAVDSLLSEVVAVQQEVSNSRFSTTGSMHARTPTQEIGKAWNL